MRRMRPLDRFNRCYPSSDGSLIGVVGHPFHPSDLLIPQLQCGPEHRPAASEARVRGAGCGRWIREGAPATSCSAGRTHPSKGGHFQGTWRPSPAAVFPLRADPPAGVLSSTPTIQYLTPSDQVLLPGPPGGSADMTKEIHAVGERSVVTTVDAPQTRHARRPAELLKAYIGLMKLRVIELLLVTTIPAMILAEGGIPSPWLVIATLLGGTMAAGSANALNCVVDADIDKVMQRTRARPLVRHTVSD